MSLKPVLALALLIPIFAAGCSKGTHPTTTTQTTTQTVQLSPAEMQEAWTKASTPNVNHKVLEPLVGKWKAQTKFWEKPDGQPTVSEATAENRWVFNGRYVEEKFRGTWNGQPFEGVGVWGFDNVAKKYQSSWFDSMSTQMMLSTGDYNPTNQSISLVGKMSCPMTGELQNVKTVTTIIDNSNHRFEMYNLAPDGKEFKSLEINYTRVPEKNAAKKLISKEKTDDKKKNG